ncbi:MAG: hypothetical protein ACXWK0_09670 [Caulobacteraceae bacterium]
MKRLFLGSAAALALSASAHAQEAASGDHAHMSMPASTAGGMDMASMESSLGSYPMSRDASGTSWQADASREGGLMAHSGGWMLMAHGVLNGVYDSQSGPRGGDKAFASGMLMGMAQRQVGEGNTLQLRAMVSPDPIMGPSGYPLLLATGETADGKTPLVDRQHPHDLVMELSASLSHAFGVRDSAFVYAGLPGEPAFGPPTFMHRLSGMDNAAAPITHHWLDSTHVTFGVVTAGWVHRNLKLEVSAFKGREPDQHRYDIESPRLDSQAVRLSWNPDAHWSLQASWAHQKSPEQLEPEANEDRWSASAIYTLPLGKDGWWSSTLAYGSKRSSVTRQALGGFVAESAVKPNDPWTLYLRAETVENAELAASGAVERVGQVSFGAVHDWRVARRLKFGVGAQQTFDFAPRSLGYGSDPRGTLAFVRLKID